MKLSDIRSEVILQSKRYPALVDFANEVLPQLADDIFDALPGLSLLLIPEDGIRQGVHREILERYGDKIIHVSLQPFTEADSENLYHDGLRTNTPGRMISSWWIKNKVFQMGGEALVIILRDMTLHLDVNKILALKGASDPTQAQPNTLRHKYRTPSKTFGLVHSSDDWFSFLYELSVLLGKEWLLSYRHPRPPSTALCYSQQRLLSLYTPLISIPRISYFRCLYTVKNRLLFRGVSENLFGADTAAVMQEFIQNYVQAENLLGTGLDLLTEQRQISKLLKEEQSILADLEIDRTCPQKICLYILWKTLTDEARFSALDFSTFKTTLTAAQVWLDPLESLVLESGFFFYKVPEKCYAL